jgi:hypothetical protein
MTVCTEIKPSVFWGIAQSVFFVTDVSAHLIGPILKSQAVEEEYFICSLTLEGRTYRLSRNLSKYLPVTCAISQQCQDQFIQKLKSVVTHVKKCLVLTNKKTSNILISVTFRH